MRWIDMTEAQKSRVAVRHVRGNAPAIASWIDQLRRDWRDYPDQRADFASMGEKLQALHVEAVGRRHP